ncbi:MAG: TonB-dependent receptor [Ignavibacteriales bacterium]|nr:MAG: TonB-dependent receptor [Ignavibacteriales bacterium]
MKLLFTLSFAFLLYSSIFSQTKITGKITDEANQPLPGANIYIKNTYDGVSSEADGSFSFTTDEEGEFVLVVSFVGYQSYSEYLTLDKKEKYLEIKLKEESTELGAVVISAGSFEASDENKAVILKPLDILTTGADADIYSTLETLPGTQQIGETDGLFVRGGSASETKTLIDEMTVQNPFYGSVPDIPSRGRFSPMLFKGTVFSTGGYSAQYGQALSSVLVLKTQDLPDKTRSAINIMPLGLGGSHTQLWEKSSFAFEGGYYNLAPYFEIQKQRPDWDKAPESFEGSANFRFKTSKTGMLKAFTSFSTGALSLYFPNLDSLPKKDFYHQKSTNFFINTNYRDIFWDDWTLFAGYSLGVDNIDNEINNNLANTDDLFHTGKVTITKNVLSNTFLTFGGEFQNLDHTNSFNDLEGNINETYLAGYLEADVFFTNDFAGRIGVRTEHSNQLDKTNFAPRMSFAYRLGVYDQLNFAYGKFYQTPDPDFLFFSKNFEFENADHYIFNYQYIGTDRTFRIEAYYKNYNNLAKGSVMTYPYFNLPDVPFGSNGKGYAKGIDIFWRDKETFEYIDYWISYSYLDTKREFKNYPTLTSPPFSTPHTFSIVAKRWIQPITTLVGLTYTFATGRPYFNPNNQEFLGDRSKNFQNLSLNASYITNVLGNFTVIFFSIDNILGDHNVYGYNYSTDGTVSAPILPAAHRSFFIGMFISLGETNPY